MLSPGIKQAKPPRLLQNPNRPAMRMAESENPTAGNRNI
jgi:hypothetical protein